MKILSIETSCDDTGISIMEVCPPKRKTTGSAINASFKVLANNVSSQVDIHIPYGGVYPALAKREHIKNLPILLELCLKQAKLRVRQDLTRSPVNAIAVTYGPGLEMCLWEGITFAKELAKKWSVPLIPVNHMEGHIFSVFGKDKGTFKIQKLKAPILILLVSGGHTQLVLAKKCVDLFQKSSQKHFFSRLSQADEPRMSDFSTEKYATAKKVVSGKTFERGLMNYEIIGETLDDAVGEAFDKVARMLGLPYPGGPQISRLAGEERKNPSPTPPRRRGENSTKLPRPMLYTKDFNFSFSGLKTAVLYLVRDLGGIKKINQTIKMQIALEFENAAIECLVYKTAKAIEKYKIKTLIVAGGVAANQRLKNEMKKIAEKKVSLFFPPKELTGDNSIMIGIAGYLNYIKNKRKVPKLSDIKATGNLRL